MSSYEGAGPFEWFLLAVRFLLEVGALAALAYWGFQTGETALTRTLLAVATPVAAAALWGAFVAPKAFVRAPAAVRILVEALVFGAAVGALVAADRILLAIGFGVVAAVDSLLVHIKVTEPG